jgi:hypothetical protein
MDQTSKQDVPQEARQRIIDFLRLVARDVVNRLRAEQKLDSRR